VLGFSQKSQAQRYKYKRIYDEFYDEKLVHFGFLFGFGDARFNLYHESQVASPLIHQGRLFRQAILPSLLEVLPILR
jgi:hypothetical protein